MPKNEQLKLAHVLFIDIVGYSRLLNDEQREFLQTLNEIIRDSDEFRRADEDAKLKRLPTGDGMALVFFTSPSAPVECAIEISTALKQHPELRVRMGIHTGPVNDVTDLNERANVAGGGINMAQRVMDCADAGHILMSKRVAEDLGQYRHWQPFLHDLGEVEVKHGVAVQLVNFYGDEFGNAAPPAKVKPARRPLGQTLARYRLWAAVIAVLVLGIAAAAFLLPRIRQPQSAEREKSIAVLPFVNLSAAADTEYFSDGITEELITTLGRVEGLKVAARSSAFQFKGRNADAREVGKRLGVTQIVEGSVRHEADRLRISVQLIDTNVGQQIWSESYDRKMADVFAIQEEIAQGVVAGMQIPRTGERPKLVTEHTKDMHAHQAYLRGRYFWNKRNGEGLKLALQYLEQAIERDPTYALAYAGIADTYLLLPLHTPLSTRIAYPRAKAAASRAVELDDELAEGHTSLAYVLFWNDWDYPAAERAFRRAIQLSPNYPTAHHWYSDFLVTSGRLNEAIDVAARAVELDPLSPIISTDAAANFYFARRYDEAVARLQQVLELDPGFLVARWYLAKSYAQQGKHAAGIAELRHAVDENPSSDWSKAFLGYAYGAAGDKAAAEGVLKQMQAEAHQRYVRPDIMGLLYLAVGHKEEALAAFEQAVGERAVYPFMMARDPQLDPLRSEPRFQTLLELMRIPSSESM